MKPDTFFSAGFSGGTQWRGEEEGKSVFEANPSLFKRAEQVGEGQRRPARLGEDEGKCRDRRLPWKPHSRAVGIIYLVARELRRL